MADKQGVSQKSQGAYGFDPVGLERAAKAAKDLDNSPHAKDAFMMAMKQEETKKVQAQAQIKQYDIQRVQIEQSEKRKTLETELDISKQKSLFDDELAKRRYQDQLQQHAEMQERNRKKDEESIAKQEQMKRQTVQYKSQMQREANQAKIIAQERAKIERMHQTQDLQLEQIKLKEAERRRTLKELWAMNLEAVGSGMRSYLSDFGNLMTLAGGLTLVFFGFQGAKATGQIATAFIQARIGMPSLVRDTSRKTSLWQYCKSPFSYVYSTVLLKGRLGLGSKTQQEQDILSGIFISESLEADLKTIAHSVVCRKNHNAPLRNLLLHGPPGTGKTMFAKSLAANSGMDYAIFTGGDIGPLGRNGVTELHKLFDWASTSRRGVVLFMDEADAFLRRRDNETIGEDLRNSLNALLYRTGSASDNFMLVLASNAPEQLDRAVHDRMDEMVFFGKPPYEQRLGMLYHYLLQYCTPCTSVRQRIRQVIEHPWSLVKRKTEIGMQGVEATHIEEVARKTEGFSGRELYKLVIAWHDAAFNVENAVLTPVLMEEVLEGHIAQHEQRIAWATRS
jgi:ATPase family AAA domain-containing protein 3A/B